MSSIRGIGDAFAFQRLLWLLVGTVIIPTVLLSLYGVMAIRNQQAALVEEFRNQQRQRLVLAARQTYADLERLDAVVRQGVSRCTPEDGTVCPFSRDGVSSLWLWRVGEPAPDDLASLGLPAPTDRETLWFLPGDGSDPIAVFDQGSTRVAWRLEEALFHQQLVESFELLEGGELVLEEVALGPALPPESEPDQFEVELALERPLSRYRLALGFPNQDPAELLLGPTAWLYPLGLVLLVATVIAGTVITLNSASREIQLSRLQTDFVSNVSHELRTPLTSIRMFVETLQSGRIKDPDRIQECLDLLSQETDRLSRMIERVLNWARMEAGRRVYDTEPVHPTDLVKEAVAALKTQTFMDGDAIGALSVEIPEDAPMLDVERDAIVEALLNLMQNAVKYAPQPREIRVACRTEAGLYGISVTDNGPGIPPAHRKRVFEKFYQVNAFLNAPGQSGSKRGSGLGLAIVRAVALGHGGKVTLESEINEGSTFTLWLPVS